MQSLIPVRSKCHVQVILRLPGDHYLQDITDLTLQMGDQNCSSHLSLSKYNVPARMCAVQGEGRQEKSHPHALLCSPSASSCKICATCILFLRQQSSRFGSATPSLAAEHSSYVKAAGDSRQQLPHPCTTLQHLFSWLIAAEMQEVNWVKTPLEAHQKKNQEP